MVRLRRLIVLYFRATRLSKTDPNSFENQSLSRRNLTRSLEEARNRTRPFSARDNRRVRRMLTRRHIANRLTEFCQAQLFVLKNCSRIRLSFQPDERENIAWTRTVRRRNSGHNLVCIRNSSFTCSERVSLKHFCYHTGRSQKRRHPTSNNIAKLDEISVRIN